ncbi:MAG: DegT/DnrJ/EryC1/StrS family aminotransferase [Thiotrichales bacterium]|nr:DegT/DnrJ/EryC1/StrS family aminotransferase [Thiotrichales bacterium]
MQFIDLKQQYRQIEESVNKRIQAVLQHGRFIMGPEVGELEEQLAGFTNTRHCIAVSSGTDALLIAMLALELRPGDEVITTPFTFISTGEMIALLGAIPVFVDIDPDTCNISPAAIENAISPKTRLIMPVSLYGQCAEFDEINAIAEKHGLPVIEDAAQSFGATYKEKPSCSLTTIGCTSFFPSKPLGGYGDGGACFTNDDALAKAMREIRVHGQDRRYHHPRIGLNGRMDTLQAAILLEKLGIFPDEVGLRSEVGRRYTEILNVANLPVKTPYVHEHNTSVYAQYTIALEDREGLQEYLNKREIPTAIHYPVPLHKQPAFQKFRHTQELNNAENAAQSVISLPMHPYLSRDDQNTICEEISGFFEK